MPDFDAMPSSSRCQLLAAMGSLALARTASAQDTAPPRNTGAARGPATAISGACAWTIRRCGCASCKRLARRQSHRRAGHRLGQPQTNCRGHAKCRSFAADWLRISPSSRMTAAADTRPSLGVRPCDRCTSETAGRSRTESNHGSGHQGQLTSDSFRRSRRGTVDPKASVATRRFSDRSTGSDRSPIMLKNPRSRQHPFAAGKSRPTQGRRGTAASKGLQVAVPTRLKAGRTKRSFKLNGRDSASLRQIYVGDESISSPCLPRRTGLSFCPVN